MRSFQDVCAQGDVLIRKVKSIPKSAKVVAPSGNEVIVTHSESGHSHVMVLDRTDNPSVEMFSSTDNPLIAWLKVNRPTALEHQRSFDTHESIMFEPGIYEVRRQREYSPEGWRQVMD